MLSWCENFISYLVGCGCIRTAMVPPLVSVLHNFLLVMHDSVLESSGPHVVVTNVFHFISVNVETEMEHLELSTISRY